MKTSNISKLAGVALGLTATQASPLQAHELTQQQRVIYEATCSALEASWQIDCNDASVMQHVLHAVSTQEESGTAWPTEQEYNRLQQYTTQVIPPEMKE